VTRISPEPDTMRGWQRACRKAEAATLEHYKVLRLLWLRRARAVTYGMVQTALFAHEAFCGMAEEVDRIEREIFAAHGYER